MTAQRWLATPVGPLLLAASAHGLTEVRLPGGAAPPPDFDAGERGDAAAAAIVNLAATQLMEYFDGRRRHFDLPLDLSGGDFQTRAWRQIAAIRFGETVSYGEVAARAGSPGASRAAGAACGANPLAIVVPCHRVVASDASLHGYGGGLEMKRWLLEHEGVRVENLRVRRPALVV